MAISKIKRPDRNRRRVQRVSYSDDIKAIYSWFIKPVTEHLSFRENEDEFEARTETFFGLHLGRSVIFAKAKEPIRIPGKRWVAENQPMEFVLGDGDRFVQRDAGLILRSDTRSPDRNEVEFKEQVFMLTAAEFAELLKKVVVVA